MTKVGELPLLSTPVQKKYEKTQAGPNVRKAS